jgi:hypothetical protein
MLILTASMAGRYTSVRLLASRNESEPGASMTSNSGGKEMNMTVAQTASGTEIEARGGAGEIIKAGVVAGIIGGMLMAMIMMVATAAGGMGLLAPLRLIAAD